MAFVLEPRTYDDSDVRVMVEEVQQEYVQLYGSPDAAAIDPAEFQAPGGYFVVGMLDGAPVATGGWRRLNRTDAEIKRMYVRSWYRRRGLSRLVLAGLEEAAAAAGVARLVLNTGPRQPGAIALYEASGYEPTAPFGHYADWPDALFYGKRLPAAA